MGRIPRVFFRAVRSGGTLGTFPVVAAEMDWGDGNVETFNISNLSAIFTHQFDAPGNYPVRVRGIDSCGNVGAWSAPYSVTITPSPPPSLTQST